MIFKIIDGIVDYWENTDKILWFILISATTYGMILINSMQRSGDYNFLKTQIVAAFLGYIGAIIISSIDYHIILKYWYIPVSISLLLCFAVFFFGMQVHGTDDTAWLRLPGGYTFQPSELAKIGFIISFAKHLDYLNKTDKIKSFLSVVSLFIHAMIPVIIIHIQGDDGSALIFIMMFLFTSFIAGVPLKYYIISLLGILGFLPFLWNNFLNNEHRNRIMVLFNLDENALSNYGWQQYQGKVSIASGQLFGSGLNNGTRVESGIVPEQENDFIFTVAGEELGFVGCVILLLILFIMMFKVLINLKFSGDNAGSYICAGFFAVLSSQVIINIAMVLGFLPVIGITLPFFSAGGTSSMCLYFGFGLVQSVYIYKNNIDEQKVKIEKFNPVI